MGRPAGWMRELTGRGAMHSPGAPSLRRETERLFWEQIATGITSEKRSGCSRRKVLAYVRLLADLNEVRRQFHGS